MVHMVKLLRIGRGNDNSVKRVIMNLEELEKKFETISNIEEIKKLHREYMFWVNARQWDDVVNCFTENASVLLPRHGLFKGKSVFGLPSLL